MSWVYLYQIKIQSVGSNQSCSENASGTVFFAHPVVQRRQKFARFALLDGIQQYPLRPIQQNNMNIGSERWKIFRNFAVFFSNSQAKAHQKLI
ncbi:MAG: hypothetical protein GY820_28545 [Gammaproteobacteria bacterium]|nr:hypothetical protein [Gammaproteobacteria bacterium]